MCDQTAGNRELPMSISGAKYLLDSNLFNHVLDEGIPVEEFRNITLIVTHVQLDELSATQVKNPARATALLALFEQMGPDQTPTRSAVWDVSAWDQAAWSDEDGVFERMLVRLKALDAASRKRTRNPSNQQRDILIAETAVKNGLTLVSGDANLRRVTIEFGGSAINLTELRRTQANLTMDLNARCSEPT
jgi:hypothetical protein